METFEITEDIHIACLEVSTFPQGIKPAFDQLGKTLPPNDNRHWYSISYCVGDKLVYKAAANEIEPGEATKFGYEPFTIPKGTYLCVTLTDWMGKEQTIGPTFDKMLKDPRADKNFPAVEIYTSDKEMKCLIKVK
jgi:hypothetical protein